MSKFNFEILGKDVKSDARAGVIHTVHGDIKTPSFVPVGTQATVKSMSNEDLQEIGVQVFFVNTYHLYLRPGLEAIEKGNGLHSFIGWGKPLMTDSAGFQIFSLGDVNRQRRLCLQGDTLQVPLVKIGEEGVKFRSHLDGSEHFFTPEKSIEAQIILGADMMIAFDECCYYPVTYDYAKKAMERTHRWALRCLERSSKFHLEEIPQGGQVQSSKLGKSPQALYGVVQGGVFEDLRKESAKFISNLPFEGVAIGGVAVGESKKEMEKVLDWVVPLLPKEKPRHLLGVGEIDDIFTLVEKGIDSFDCVMPTRLGRMGHLLVRKVENREWKLDITKAMYASDKRPIDENCDCFVCRNYNRGYINHLFRAKELLAYRLCTFHNLFFLENLMREIRTAIKEEKLDQVKKKWLQ